MNNRSYKATESQQILFKNYELYPQNDAYNLSFLYRLTGKLDKNRLSNAMKLIIASSPGLRSNFEKRDGELWVYHVPADSAVIMKAIPNTDRAEEWVKSHIEFSYLGRRIDPTDPNPMQVVIYYNDFCNYLFIQASHLIGDAYSFYQLVKVLELLYDSPDDSWAQIAADNCYLHPGNISRVAPFSKNLDLYKDLLKHIEKTAYSGPNPIRADGRILGKNIVETIEGELAKKIKNSWANKELGTSTVFFAAYAAALHRLAGDDAVILGIPLANRIGHKAHHAFGYFVNTLPLPIIINEQTSWIDLCQQINSGVKILQRCQNIDLNRPEFCRFFNNSKFSTNNAITYYKEGLLLKLPGIEVQRIPLNRPSITYPLTVNVTDLESAYELEICLQCNISEIDFYSLILDSIKKIVDFPESKIIQTNYRSIPAPPIVFQESTSIVDLIELSTLNNPHKIAISDDSDNLSYEQLWKRSEEIAHLIEHENFGRYVVISVERSIATIATILGVLRSGRAYIPLDPNSPRERKQIILDCIADSLGRVPNILSPCDIPGDINYREKISPPMADDLAYIIFTSGSTGRPKGVKIKHGNVVSLMRSSVKKYRFIASDRWSLFHSMAFDFSVWEIFGCLTSGGTLLIPTADTIKNPVASLSWLQKNQITVFSQTPSGFRRYSRFLNKGFHLKNIRFLIFGGEPLYVSDLLSWWKNHSISCTAVNMYGITETTVHSTERHMKEIDAILEESVIGEAMEHVNLDILDNYGRPCPIGIIGEIVISGTGVSSGYLGMPLETKKRFRALQTTDRGVVAAYRSGDLARRTNNGEIVFHGRADRQIQLRGYRIEIGEIEMALNHIHGVNSAVVTLEKPENSEPFLISWFEGSINEREVLTELSSRLPEYMIPANIIQVEKIPVNQNGKPDLTLLKNIQHKIPKIINFSDKEKFNQELNTALEIIKIFEKVIGVRQVELDSRFMEVGGTSMHIVPIAEKISRLKGGELFEITDLYEFPTPRMLASHLISLSESENGD